MKKMSKSTIQRRFALALILFTILISGIWFGYYRVTYNSARNISLENAELAAARLIDRINGEFSQMRSVAGVITGSSYIQDFLAAETVEEFFIKADNASAIIRNAAFPNLEASNIIAFNESGRFYRFVGRLSNDSCEKLYGMVRDSGTIFTVVELDGVLFFCHSAPVFSFLERVPKRIGAITLLTHIDSKRTALGVNSMIDSAIVKAGFVIVASDETLEGMKFAEIEPMYGLFSHSAIEGTDLTVTAFVKKEATFPERMFFYIASFTMITILLIAVIGLYRYASGYILLPLEIEKQKALIFSLKKQINAHFTNHTLNTIRILIKQNEPQKAEAVTIGLSALIRYAHDKEEFINIWDELSVIKDYIVIMNTRYNGKLEVDFDFDDRLMDYEMPRMLLQPILENAIVHGFADADSECVISVKAEKVNDSAIFHIRDYGCGMDDEQLAALRDKLSIDPDAARGYENIALLNIKNRLWNYYGGVGEMAVAHNEGGGVYVMIKISI